MTVPPLVVRIALIAGGAIDLGVGVLALFFQPLMQPLLDFPVKDPALTTVAGGEFALVGAMYFFLVRDPERFRPLFWLVAVDQLFAAGLVALEISRGHVAGTWKTVGPIPLNLALVVIFVLAARARGRSAA